MSDRINLSRRVAMQFGLLSILLLSGCGKSEPWNKVYPVNGVVTYKGKPVKDAELAFFPLDEQVPDLVRPFARTNENGEFSLTTFNHGDGAPAGKYKVTVVHHEVVVVKDIMTAKPNNLPRKYSNRDSSDLVIEVASRETALEPFELR